MFPILLTLGPLTLRTYGVLVALAFLAALTVARAGARKRNVPEAFILDFAAVTLFAGLLGARLFYVLLNAGYFKENPGEILQIWQGGLVFYGGFVTAALAGLWLTRRRHQRVGVVADIAAPALAFGQAIGRLGCLMAGCCYGKPTDIFCAIQFKHPQALAPLGIGLHPTQIYESVVLLIIGGGLTWRLKTANDPPGTLFWFYVLAYGLARFALEFLRGDLRGGTLAGMYPSQWFALIAVIVAGSILVTQASDESRRRP